MKRGRVEPTNSPLVSCTGHLKELCSVLEDGVLSGGGGNTRVHELLNAVIAELRRAASSEGALSTSASSGGGLPLTLLAHVSRRPDAAGGCALRGYVQRQLEGIAEAAVASDAKRCALAQIVASVGAGDAPVTAPSSAVCAAVLARYGLSSAWDGLFLPSGAPAPLSSGDDALRAQLLPAATATFVQRLPVVEHRSLGGTLMRPLLGTPLSFLRDGDLAAYYSPFLDDGAAVAQAAVAGGLESLPKQLRGDPGVLATEALEFAACSPEVHVRARRVAQAVFVSSVIPLLLQRLQSRSWPAYQGNPFAEHRRDLPDYTSIVGGPYVSLSSLLAKAKRKGYNSDSSSGASVVDLLVTDVHTMVRNAQIYHGPPGATRATPRTFPPPALLPEQYRADRGGVYGIACDVEEGLALWERHARGALESLRTAALRHATRGNRGAADSATRAVSARAAAGDGGWGDLLPDEAALETAFRLIDGTP